MRQHFYEVSLEYVFKVQEVQERKMFDFVEPVRTCFFKIGFWFSHMLLFTNAEQLLITSSDVS